MLWLAIRAFCGMLEAVIRWQAAIQLCQGCHNKEAPVTMLVLSNPNPLMRRCTILNGISIVIMPCTGREAEKTLGTGLKMWRRNPLSPLTREEARGFLELVAGTPQTHRMQMSMDPPRYGSGSWGLEVLKVDSIRH